MFGFSGRLFGMGGVAFPSVGLRIEKIQKEELHDS